jgi:hypothetical protein
MKKILTLLLLLMFIQSCGGSNYDDGFSNDEVCMTCDETIVSGSQYCIYHSCEECGELKDIDDKYCSEHKCEECGELKDSGDRYCEEHKCEECGELKDSFDDYCEEHMCGECGELKDSFEEYCNNCQADLFCPNCGGLKELDVEEYCTSCEDEIYNTCSQCGGWDYMIHGGVCDYCLGLFD